MKTWSVPCPVSYTHLDVYKRQQYIIELLKAVFLGIVEGITEWLPISSTGHLILVNEFLNLRQSKDFIDMFNIVIQLGAILAVMVIYFKRLNPFQPGKTAREVQLTWQLWLKVDVYKRQPLDRERTIFTLPDKM